MHRWATRFGTIWLSLLVPSLVGWGIVVRWNPSGVDRFERTWTWLADLLAFPLVVQALTDRSWLWLKGDSAPLATSGFAILLVGWCLMIALPTSILLSWADWLGNRISPSTHLSSATSYNAYASPHSSSSALNALYLITVPLALLGHAIRWLVRILRPAMITFAIIWVCVYVGYVIALHRSNAYVWPTQLQQLNDAWNGYLGTLGFHHVFADAWQHNLTQSALLARDTRTSPLLWHDMIDNTTEYPFVLKLLALFAAMHALIVAVVVGLLAALLRTGRQT